jgi:hypothetical protein
VVILRALVLLAATMPLFAATAFRPLWWQTLLAAMIGSAAGQVAVRFTRGRRVAQWSVAMVAASIVGAAAVWALTRGARHDDSPGNAFLIVSSSGESFSLTWDDVEAIKTQIPSVDLAVPYSQKMELLLSEEMNWSTHVVGTTPDYFDLMALHVVAGDRFDASSESGNKVVVLGDTVAAQLFGAAKSAVGEVVRIKDRPFTIIGVLAHRGMSRQGQDLDDVALVPIKVYAAKLEASFRFGGAVFVSARSREEMPHVEAEVRSLLRIRHRLAPGNDDDFIIRTPN